MSDTRPKHKPNEKHTLDEVLKSLQDLVRGDVLTKPAPPPAAKAPPAVTPPRADMGDIIRSLEHLLESDLELEDKKVEEKPAAPAKTPSPPRAQTREVPRAVPEPAAIAPAPKPAPPAAPPPPPPPLLDTEDELEIEMASQPAVEPLTFPEEMSDEDIAKALADLQFDMDATQAPQPELETIEAAPPPEPEREPTAIVEQTPVPKLELTLVEPPPEIAQHELTLEEAAPPTTNLADFDSDLALEAQQPEMPEEEIVAAPPPPEPETAGDFETIDFSSDTPSEEVATDLTPAPTADNAFSVDFTPSPRKAPRKEPEPEPEDLAPPPSTDDELIDLAEPTTSDAGDSSGSLGESIDIDLGNGGESGSPTPTADLETPAGADTTPTTEVTEPEPAPSAAPAKEIPVLKNIALASTAPPSAPPAESFTLELTPTTPPKPAAAATDLHQMAVRVIAKLNIELRKAGKAPLDAKTINRLQQLLKEALEKK